MAAQPKATRVEDTPLMDADPAQRAWQAMRTLIFELHDSRNEVSETLGMSFIRAKALMKLAGGPLTMRELAARLATDPPYTSVVVDDLEQRGLLTRTTNPSDRRVKVVEITPAGAEAAATASAIQNRPPAAFDRLSEAELRSLDRILAKLSAAPPLKS